MKIITTSWDDGHPLDFKLAELLDKYNLKGTFYVPKANKEQKTMCESEIKTLSNYFEIGAHTLNHVRLYKNFSGLESEVNGSYAWLQNILERPPICFCFPGGVYNDKAVACAYASGFKILRTTRLLSPHLPEHYNLLETTLQMYNHRRVTYLKHLIKHVNFNCFFLWLKGKGEKDILSLVEYYLNYIDLSNGCFHFWGHSWEIEQLNLWKNLELVFRHISQLPGFQYITNGDFNELK